MADSVIIRSELLRGQGRISQYKPMGVYILTKKSHPYSYVIFQAFVRKYSHDISDVWRVNKTLSVLMIDDIYIYLA